MEQMIKKKDNSGIMAVLLFIFITVVFYTGIMGFSSGMQSKRIKEMPAERYIELYQNPADIASMENAGILHEIYPQDEMAEKCSIESGRYTAVFVFSVSMTFILFHLLKGSLERERRDQ